MGISPQGHLRAICCLFPELAFSGSSQHSLPGKGQRSASYHSDDRSPQVVGVPSEDLPLQNWLRALLRGRKRGHFLSSQTLHLGEHGKQDGPMEQEHGFKYFSVPIELPQRLFTPSVCSIPGMG